MCGRGSRSKTAVQTNSNSAGTRAAKRDDSYWGSADQPYWRPGANPTVDNIITRGDSVLMIRRSVAPGTAEAGKWALPGGFWDTEAKKGETWTDGKETSRQAALRELQEETGLSISELEDHLEPVGRFDKFGRDPRDNKDAWAISEAFKLELPENIDSRVTGLDDADEARWFKRSELKELEIAFDHKDILKSAGITVEN